MASREKEIKIMAEMIISSYGKQAYFNIKEAADIVGCGRNTLPSILHGAGILVKPVGTSNRISAYTIAEIMCSGLVAPVSSK